MSDLYRLRVRLAEVEAERDAALALVSEHRCDVQAEAAYDRVLRLRAENAELAATVERVRALASGMGMPRPGADADRDSALTRMKLRSAGHRILRALDGGES